ncbi:NAD dependent epimerase/dehydratase [Xylariaceae sp. FL0255]|nr:NAD dependent epimerase/dehydratase [Xylariaceae sp. FL0255]
MPDNLVFVTGGSGFIGSATVVALLKKGYRLRVCLCEPSDKFQILVSSYKKLLDLIVVPDFTSEGAFRGLLDGVDHVVHLAHPLPIGADKNSYFIPAIKTTKSLLDEAAQVATIKKFVLTSSIAALMPLDLEKIPPTLAIKEENPWDLSFDETEDFSASNDPRGVPMRLYHASKLLADRTAKTFRDTKKPSFSMVTVYPGFVYGRNLAQSSAEEVNVSSNGLLWHAIMQGSPHLSGAWIPAVHIDDVVEAYMKILGSAIVDGSGYLLVGETRGWKKVAEIVQRDYPALGARITRDIGIEFLKTDASKTEAELGLHWRRWEEIIHDVVEQQLEFKQ